MDENDDNTRQDVPPRGPWTPSRLPRWRTTALLATATLAIGVAAGAAIGPTPEASLAGTTSALSSRVPLLVAQIESQRNAEAAAAQAAEAKAAAADRAAKARQKEAATSASKEEEPASTASSKKSESSTSKEEKTESESSESGSGKKKSKAKKPLPPVSAVWFIQLSGTSLSTALAQPTAAPYITQLAAQGAVLGSWSALDASAFASEAGLVEPPSAGATPPLLHTIVQPPCPEGAAGASCAPETPGQLTAADEFLKATLATIVNTPAYKEHGLVVITFSSVGLASQAGLPEGSSTATLTYQPPAGVLLLSPFAKAGSKPTTTFTPASPRQTVEALLHK
jgi:hypothetical protein